VLGLEIGRCDDDDGVVKDATFVRDRIAARMQHAVRLIVMMCVAYEVKGAVEVVCTVKSLFKRNLKQGVVNTDQLVGTVQLLWGVGWRFSFSSFSC